MAKLHLVWNTGMSECVGFLDEEGDANYTATGDNRHLDHPAMTPTIGDAFREAYGDQQDHLPQTVVEVPDRT